MEKDVVSYPFPKQALVFTCLQYKSFENTVGKGEIARNEQFLLFPQCFLPVWRTFCHFHKIRHCRLPTVSVWKSLKFVDWERVKQIQLWFMGICEIRKFVSKRCNFLIKNKVLDQSKFESFIDDKIYFAEKLKFCMESVENIVGKEKLLAFSPFPIMFLTLSHTSPGFYVSAVQVFWKHCGQKRNCSCNKQFLIFPKCFPPFWRTLCHFHQIWNCRLQFQFGTV